MVVLLVLDCANLAPANWQYLPGRNCYRRHSILSHTRDYRYSQELERFRIHSYKRDACDVIENSSAHAELHGFSLRYFHALQKRNTRKPALDKSIRKTSPPKIWKETFGVCYRAGGEFFLTEKNGAGAK